jgi:hypothetical protein
MSAAAALADSAAAAAWRPWRCSDVERKLERGEVRRRELFVPHVCTVCTASDTQQAGWRNVLCCVR